MGRDGASERVQRGQRIEVRRKRSLILLLLIIIIIIIRRRRRRRRRIINIIIIIMIIMIIIMIVIRMIILIIIAIIITITITIQPSLTDFQTGQDKRGCRRSAAIPPNELSCENVDKMLQQMPKCYKMWQDVTKCGNACALQTKDHRMQGMCGPSVKTPFVLTRLEVGERRLYCYCD